MPKKGLFGGVMHAYPSFEFKKPEKIFSIPHFDSHSRVDIEYPLLPPYASAKIQWSSKEKRLMYNIVEPRLSKSELSSLKNMDEALREIIDVKLTTVKKAGNAIEYLQEKIAVVLNDLNLNLKKDSYQRIMYYIVRDFIGLNEIEPMMHDPYIEDISCNGVSSPIFIVHRRFGSIETSLIFNEPDHLSDFVVKMAERCGRYISYASPLLDGSLPDGSRVQASLAKDVTTRGPTFSIRKFRSNPFSPVDLINLRTCSSSMMAYLWLLIQYNVSIMICGGVSTGKTTFLNAISMFIPPENKVISIEDTREINIPHENWTPSVARTGFGIVGPGGKRYGEVDLFDLLKESFRQNPSYVVVGEIRGKEAYVMFQGMSSGHASLGTIHAGSVDDVMKRLETPPIELSPSLIDALDVLIVMTHAREKGKSARRVKEIVEIQSVDSRTGNPITKETFSWIASADDYRDDSPDSDVLKRISFEQGLGYGNITAELDKRKKILDWMSNHDIFFFKDVCRIVNLYYKEPKTVMDWVTNNKTPYTKERVKKAEKADTKAKKAVRKAKAKSQGK
jgi:flagellar protein FlaI